MATPLRMRMSRDSTTKVYGRSSASLTSHIVCDYPHATPRFGLPSTTLPFHIFGRYFQPPGKPSQSDERIETTIGVNPKLRQIHPERLSEAQPSVFLRIESDSQGVPKKSGAGKAHIDTRGLAPP